MVFRKNILFDFCDHVVSLDIPEIKSWSAIESWMEIFITHQYDQFIAGNIDSDHGLAFLVE